MNTKELTAALGVTRIQLSEWIAQGLPHSRKGNGRIFDPQHVHNWLVVNGKAKNASVVGTLAEAAKAIGVHERTVAGWIAMGCPGRPGEYDIDAITTWHGAGRQGDPLLTGPTSPALEKYREEREKIARLDRLARERRLVDRVQLLDDMRLFSGTIRRGIEQLQREFGAGAYDIAQSAVDEATAAVERKYSNPTLDGAIADEPLTSDEEG